MNNVGIFYLTFITVFIFSFPTTYAKSKCYVCGWSHNSSPCGDENFGIPKDSNGLYFSNCTACYKKTIYDKKGEKQIIKRYCSMDHPHYAVKCQNFYWADKSYESTCTCLGEYCNGTPHRSASFIELSSVVLAAIFINFLAPLT